MPRQVPKPLPCFLQGPLLFLLRLMKTAGLPLALPSDHAAVPIPATAPIPASGALAPAQKPRFIENPLPLPKKHVKREMDYDYEVPEADMHYQIEITAGDDFDR